MTAHSLIEAHQRIAALRDALPPDDIARAIEKMGLRWCADSGAVLIGGTALDLYCRSKLGTPFYPPSKVGDVDVWMDIAQLMPALTLCDQLVEADSILREYAASHRQPVTATAAAAKAEPEFKHITVTGINASHVHIHIGDRTAIDCFCLATDLFRTIPTDTIPPSGTATAATASATAAKRGKKVTILRFDAIVRSYFRMVATSRQLNNTDRLLKNLSYLRRIGELLDKAKSAPSDAKTPALKLRTADEMSKELSRVRVPLLTDCAYAGHTALSILFESPSPASKRTSPPDHPISSGGSGSEAVEVICFGATRDVMMEYAEKHDYASHELDLSWEWESIPSAVRLEPSQTSDLPPLILLDGSTSCGQVLRLPMQTSSHAPTGTGLVLSPISIAGLCDPSLSLPLLSLLTRDCDTLLRLTRQSEEIANCVSGHYIGAIGSRMRLNRRDYISNRQFLAAALAALAKADRA